MTRAYFDQQMRRLSDLRFPPPNLDNAWDALHDLSDAALSAAVSQCQKTCITFPTPAELRQAADAAYHPPAFQEEDHTVPLTEPVTVTIPQTGQQVAITREYVYRCEDCRDTGWKGVDHGVVRCLCWQTNPVLIRKREAQRRYAEARSK
jgi:hypothetical protein